MRLKGNKYVNITVKDIYFLLTAVVIKNETKTGQSLTIKRYTKNIPRRNKSICFE
jgi:hypothetical protein